MNDLDFSGWWKTRDGHFAALDPKKVYSRTYSGLIASKKDPVAVFSGCWDVSGNYGGAQIAREVSDTSDLDLMERIHHIQQLPECLRPKKKETDGEDL